jgi:hypothetical protein
VAVVRRPLLRMAMPVPVLVSRLECDGNLLIISAMPSAGGGGFGEDDNEAIIQLCYTRKGERGGMNIWVR